MTTNSIFSIQHHSLRLGYALLLSTIFSTWLLTGVAANAQVALGSQFSYQGQLKFSGQLLNDTADFEFTLWDAETGGNLIGANFAVDNVLVEDGLFTVDLDFGVTAFNGNARWLEISVRSPSGGGAFTTLNPRQPLSGTPYALALRGLLTTSSGDQNFPDSWNVIGGHSANSVGAAVGGATIAGGGSSQFINSVSGRFGTVSGGIGNTANGIESSVGGGEVNIADGNQSTVGGGFGNFADGNESTVGGGIGNDAIGMTSTIAGGESNTANGILSTIGGGEDNFADGGLSTIGGGFVNQTITRATIGGGIFNLAGGEDSTIGGGEGNSAAGADSTVGGGASNSASGYRSTVGGGFGNQASGSRSSVPGGASCRAGGDYSFATGRRAKVRDSNMSGDADGDEGTFVWADSTNADFTSTGPDQFLIRANGGVGIGTSSPENQLSVVGNADFSGSVGVGTTNPGNKLSVLGNADFSGSGGDAVLIENTSNGRGLRAVAPLDTAVWAITTSGFAGVHGRNAGASGRAVYGEATDSSGTNYGVYGRSNSASGYDFYAGGAGVNYGSSSSRRWKNNVVPISDPLQKLGKLRGVYFDWDEQHGGAHDVGMIAEEVGEVLPEIVQFEENGIDASGMDYSKMTPLLVEAVNALRIEKDREIRAVRVETDAKIASLQAAHHAEVSELRERLSELERMVKQLAVAGEGR